MTTRNGKIAHLPRALRDDLNQRLDNGVPGHELLTWLNTHPEAQAMLTRYFPGRRITQQNLSEWRQGGYQEWFKLQETHKLTLQLAKEPETAETKISPQKVMNALAQITTMEFMHASNLRMRECTSTEERWKHVCQMTTHFSRLREAEHRADTRAFNERRLAHEIAAGQRTLQKAAEATARRELLAHLEQILPGASEGRVPRVPNINPTIPQSTNPVPTPHTVQQTTNKVENPRIPSGTNPNQAHIFSTPTASPDKISVSPIQGSGNLGNTIPGPSGRAITGRAYSPSGTANPTIHQSTPTRRAVALAKAEIKAKSARFPSGTNRHQAHIFSLPDTYCPTKPTPKFLRPSSPANPPYPGATVCLTPTTQYAIKPTSTRLNQPKTK